MTNIFRTMDGKSFIIPSNLRLSLTTEDLSAYGTFPC